MSLLDATIYAARQGDATAWTAIGIWSFLLVLSGLMIVDCLTRSSRY